MMKVFKSFVIALMIAFVSFGFVACSNNNSDDSNDNTVSKTNYSVEFQINGEKVEENSLIKVESVGEITSSNLYKVLFAGEDVILLIDAKEIDIMQVQEEGSEITIGIYLSQFCINPEFYINSNIATPQKTEGDGIDCYTISFELNENVTINITADDFSTIS